MISPKLETIRHSLAHVLAAAVLEMFPQTKFGLGPAIENGFYYDFDFGGVMARSQRTKPQSNDKIRITLEDLPKIEKKMQELIKKDLPLEKEEWPIKKAVRYFELSNQNYKVELIEDLQKKERVKKVTIYQLGNFLDLCSGPHLKSTGQINLEAFKLTKIAGAYWRGDEKNPMLTRIYGVAFENKKELDKYLERQKEIEKRDHRKLGQQLDLFSSHEDVGPGIFLWHPKGAIIRNIIEDFWRAEHVKRGYQYVFTPHIGRLNLWKTSGHWDFYRESMYPPMKTPEGEYMIKPMSCPFHILIYKSRIRSYRDLPIRYNELGTVYRFEKAGTLHGLMRVRGFTQDDAHIFCRPDQLQDELIAGLDLALYMLSTFGFKEYDIELSVRDPYKKKKFMGDDKIWDKSEKALQYALDTKKLKYKVMPGEAKFYGPAIDIKLIDALGRGWQGPTFQLDFNLSSKFNVDYINQKGKKQEAIIIHRTVLGCLERFLGSLLEHYGGALPFWLAPEQIWIIPVGSRHIKYAKEIDLQLTTFNLRTKIKDENETVSKKIREGELQKIPYMLVVGDKEIKSKTVRVRDRQKGDIGPMKIDKFIKKITKEIREKKFHCCLRAAGQQ